MKRQLKNIGGERLVSVVSNDWLIRLVSLVLAVVLWAFVGREHRIDKNVMIPVEIINLPQNLVIANHYKKEIEVSVSGPRSSIADMSKSVVRQVNLARALPGTLVVDNTNDAISVPREVTVKRIQPPSIILSLDKLIKKDVPIEVRTIGQISKDYFLIAKTASPQSISITGPSTVLAQVEKIFTKTFDLTGMTHSVHMQTPLELSPQLISLIGETSVTVDLKIMPDATPAVIENVPVEGVLGTEKVAVEPALVQVKAMVPKVALAQKKDLLSLVRAVAQGDVGEDVLEVEILSQQKALPVEVISVTPSKVSVKGADVEMEDRDIPLLRKMKKKKKNK